MVVASADWLHHQANRRPKGGPNHKPPGGRNECFFFSFVAFLFLGREKCVRGIMNLDQKSKVESSGKSLSTVLSLRSRISTAHKKRIMLMLHLEKKIRMGDRTTCADHTFSHADTIELQRRDRPSFFVNKYRGSSYPSFFKNKSVPTYPKKSCTIFSKTYTPTLQKTYPTSYCDTYPANKTGSCRSVGRPVGRSSRIFFEGRFAKAFGGQAPRSGQSLRSNEKGKQ